MLLEVKKLNIKADDETIIESMSFEIWKWEIFTLLWHNGSWKTTIAKSIIWLFPSSSWEVFFNWENISDMEIYERSHAWLAYIMQEIPEYTWISVHNYSKNILKEKFDLELIVSLFDTFWLDRETYKKRSFDQHLSWWEKKKIEIIVNFMMDKQLYILDEVETSLDATSRTILKEIIIEKSKSWTSFLVISHNQDLNEICENWILICNNKLQEAWKSKDLLKKYMNKCKTCEEMDNCEHLKLKN